MSHPTPPPPRPEPERSEPERPGVGRGIVGALVGAAAGFALAYIVYVSITPVLEASTGLVRELQGLSWNLVPGLTIVGGVVGWLLARRRG